MFKKILIANRGEIALRVIRACKELGIKTVAVHSTADELSAHVQFADEDVCIGPPNSKQSYLNINQILSAAIITNSDAIHPGYGFLAENANFSRICGAHNIKFIGPSPDSINRLGDKAYAKRSMKEAGVPTVPGSEGEVPDIREALALGKSIGYPIMLKAVAGGGGRGMRTLRGDEDTAQYFPLARHEAEQFFGNPGVYMEKYIENPRHVEVQLLADRHGSVVHLGERDCSVQRRHQKLVEESPCPVLSPESRDKLCLQAVRGCAFVGYEGAGTMEFIMDQEKNLYFMEMNTRVQVEHPVTEMVTGIDIIKEQILVAAGEKLSFTQAEWRPLGHAIECRINAEDPAHNFRPSPGTVSHFHVPGGPGIRVDTHVYAGYTIPPYYDSMIAKLICHGKDRAEARVRALRCLEEFRIVGIHTTIPLLRAVLQHPDFISGNFNTNFLENSNLLKPEGS
jgi:acetyl-CoA carboxylase biotin carboxylase subunit